MKKAYVMAGVTALCWGTLPVVTKLLLTSFSNMEVLFISAAVAFLFLAVFNAATGRLRVFGSYSARDVLKLAGLGFLGLFMYSALYYFGLSELSGQDACIINYLWPMMIIVFSAVFLKERLTAKKIAAILVSFAGLVFIASKGSFSGIEMQSLKGAAACVLAAVCYGAFSVLDKKADYDRYAAMMVYFFVTAVCSGVWMLFEGGFVLPNLVQSLGFVWLGVFVQAVAYLLWALALKEGDTAKVSNAAYAVPFISVVLSAVFLGETIEWYSIAGLALIIGGILLQSVNFGRKNGQALPPQE